MGQHHRELIAFAPVLAPLEAHLLGLADVILPIITAVIIAASYAFWRWLEPRLPDWLTAPSFAKTPTYQAPAGAPVNATPSTADAAARIAAHSLDRADGPDHRQQ